MAKLMASCGLDFEIKKRVAKGMPFYGTCAGAILAAKKVAGEKRYKPLGLIDIEIGRNAYGHQADSFEAEIEIKTHWPSQDFAFVNKGHHKNNSGGPEKINGIFIRSPVIKKAGPKVEVLARLGNRPVLVRQGNVLAGTFHPETEKNFICHKMLIEMIQ